ncbi:MMPL family transporter [Humibacillus xanthopallidus]|uniref:MMPL family transporter n=1 Tax=Humibacillus xanthopallidus TaxID=412689 RepID=UPI00384A4C97
MATRLYRLGKLAYRRWPVVLVSWLIVLVGIAGVSAAISKPMQDEFSIPGIPSEQAQTLQQELFPGARSAYDGAGATIVVAAPEGQTLREPTYTRAVDDLVSALRGTPQIDADAPVVGPVAAAAGQREQLVEASVKAGQPRAVAEANAAALSPLSEDARVGTISLTFDVDKPTDIDKATQEHVAEALSAARTTGLTVAASGSALQSFELPGGSSEAIGIAIAALVLVLTFGSLVAAGLPILTALVGVGIGALGVTAATAFVNVGSTTPILATMLGLAVGIDYALFILSRYRAELLHHDDREEAAGLAVGRAGSAVVFAGLTVVIALAALGVVGIPLLTSMGIAAAATVLVAVLIALTLLPALLGMLGGKAFAGRVRRDRIVADELESEPRDLTEVTSRREALQGGDPDRRTPGSDNGGVRWARLVGRHPVIIGLLGIVLLGSLTVPVKDLHLALPTDSTSSTETSARRAADLIDGAFGPGRNAPLLLVVDARATSGGQAAGEAIGTVTSWAAGLPDVANAQVIAQNEAGTGAQVLITPRSGGDDIATEQLLAALRDGQAAQEQATGTTLGVTGVTAIQTDVSERLAGALAPYLAIVVGLAFVLLMMVFRSVLVPLTATVGFLLSVLATLGLTVLVFQEGLFGLFEPAPIMSFMPILVIGIVFGLAMDYQVFLVTRMREAYVHGDSARHSIIEGFRFSARVVTAAAIIMISVFAAFIAQDQALIQSIGFALAVAVLFDAFVVRMTLIPAVMNLLGDKAWWLPRWLDRLLPDVDVEGESLTRARAAQRGPDEARELEGSGVR